MQQSVVASRRGKEVCSTRAASRMYTRQKNAFRKLMILDILLSADRLFRADYPLDALKTTRSARQARHERAWKHDQAKQRQLCDPLSPSYQLTRSFLCQYRDGLKWKPCLTRPVCVEGESGSSKRRPFSTTTDAPAEKSPSLRPIPPRHSHDHEHRKGTAPRCDRSHRRCRPRDVAGPVVEVARAAHAIPCFQRSGRSKGRVRAWGLSTGPRPR